MREAISELITIYREITGVSIIVPLCIVSIFVICLLNNYIYEKNDKRRRINPTVFLLSIWTLISYSVTAVTEWFLNSENDRENTKTIIVFKRAVIILALSIICTMSGKFVFYSSHFEMSTYTEGNTVKIFLSVFLTIIYLTLYVVIANRLYVRKLQKTIFILYAILLNVFSVYSEKSIEYNLFLKPLSAGSIVIHLVLPAFMYIIIWKFPDVVYIKGEDNTDEETDKSEITDDEYDEEWDMKKHKILNIRNMAVAFAVFIVMFIGVIFTLNSKINSLYNATLILEQAARDKAAVYTYVSEDNQDISIQVIVAGDGLITVIGGGNYEDGVKFMEYLKQYGTNVDKWYLNSRESSETGVYEYCRNNGIVINSLYCVTGIEKVE